MFHKKIIVKIEGMKCDHCAKRVHDSLINLEDVKSVKVNLKNKNATISYKNSVDIDRISSAIEKEGFHFIGVES